MEWLNNLVKIQPSVQLLPRSHPLSHKHPSFTKCLDNMSILNNSVFTIYDTHIYNRQLLGLMFLH